MTRGHEPILAQQLLEALEQDEADLEGLDIPEPARAYVATRLERAQQLAWEIDEAQRTGQYLARTGRLPGRIEREERRGKAERVA